MQKRQISCTQQSHDAQSHANTENNKHKRTFSLPLAHKHYDALEVLQVQQPGLQRAQQRQRHLEQACMWGKKGNNGTVSLEAKIIGILAVVSLQKSVSRYTNAKPATTITQNAR